MKVKTFFKLIIVVLFLSILSTNCTATELPDNECPDDEYVEYKRVYLDTSRGPEESLYVVDESEIDAEHFRNIQVAFDFHQIKYKVLDNKIMVQCKFWKVKSDMVNFTLQADDKETLRFFREFIEMRKKTGSR